MKLKNVINSFRYDPDYGEKNTNKPSNLIIETTKQQVVPSVDEYIRALRGFDSKLIQTRTLLYDHYATTLATDNMVISLLNKRFSNIQNKSVGIRYRGEDIENSLTESPKFNNFLIDILKTKLWGFNVFEFDNKGSFDYKLLPHKHINPYRKEVLRQQYDSEGLPFSDLEDIMFIGDETDAGLLSQITLLSIYRRYAMFNYSRYLELAGENFTTIKTRGNTTAENLTNINQQMRDRVGGTLELPDGLDVQTENSSSSSQNALFEGYQKIIKEEMAILILGQTMTTFDGSSKSQADVHSAEQKNLFYEDDVYVLNQLNYSFRHYINLWDNINADEIEFYFKPNNELEMQNKLERYKELKDLGVVFTNEELRGIFKDLL